MDRRKAVSLLACLAAPCSLMGVPSAAQDTSAASNIQWVERVLVEIGRIKPGMTRADLLTVFGTEGGLSTGLQCTYVSRRCHYFKVDVTFRAVGRPGRDDQGRVTQDEDQRDQIAIISRPYLAFSIMD